MKHSDKGSQQFEAGDFLRDAMNLSPWTVLGLMHLLTQEQWEDLISGKVFERLCQDIRPGVYATLRKYPMPVPERINDAVHEVLLKLREGSFLKRYRAFAGHPRPYLLGSARQYARVIARSMWRQYLRDTGVRSATKQAHDQERPHYAGSPERSAA